MSEIVERPEQREIPLAPVTEDPRYIGTTRERPGVRRLVQGQGVYVDDIELPRMAHAVFWRSPTTSVRVNTVSPITG